MPEEPTQGCDRRQPAMPDCVARSCRPAFPALHIRPRPRLAERPERPVPDRRHLPRLLPVQPARAGARRHLLGPRQLDRPAALDGAPGGAAPATRPDRRRRMLERLRRRRRRGADRGLHRQSRPRLERRRRAGPQRSVAARLDAATRQPRDRHAGRPGDRARCATRSSSASRAGATRVQGAGRARGPSAAAALRLRRPGAPGSSSARCSTIDDPVAAEVAASRTSGSAPISSWSTAGGCCWSRSGAGSTAPTSWPGCATWSATWSSTRRRTAVPGDRRRRGGRRARVLCPAAAGRRDRTLLWGWSWELGRTADQIAAAGWAGVLTFPRELYVRDGSLGSRPAAELAELRAPSRWPGEPGAPVGAARIRGGGHRTGHAAVWSTTARTVAG